MKPFLFFIFIISIGSTSSIIAQTSERSEAGVNLYSGGFISANKGSSSGSASLVRGGELKFDLFKEQVDRFSPEKYNFFGSLSKSLDGETNQSELGVKGSKNLFYKRFGVNLLLEANSREWREGEEKSIFSDSLEGGGSLLHQLDYKVGITSTYALSERWGASFGVIGGRQLHQVEGDQVKFVAGGQYATTRKLSYELRMNQTFFYGKSESSQRTEEQIQEGQFVGTLKWNEIWQASCLWGFGQVISKKTAAEDMSRSNFYSGGCSLFQQTQTLRQSFDFLRSADKYFYSGDFLLRDTIQYNASKAFSRQERFGFAAGYVLDRKIGDDQESEELVSKRRLDFGLTYERGLDWLDDSSPVKNLTGLLSSNYITENDGSKREAIVYRMGIQAKL